jgi:hypothetical protein
VPCGDLPRSVRTHVRPRPWYPASGRRRWIAGHGADLTQQQKRRTGTKRHHEEVTTYGRDLGLDGLDRMSGGFKC